MDPASGMDDFRRPVPFEPPVFDPEQREEYLEYLAEHGYVVVQALSEDELHQAEEVFWDECAVHFGWSPDRPSTWAAKDRWVTMARRSDCGHFRGWDHSEFQWSLRRMPAVSRIYREVCRHFTGDVVTGGNGDQQQQQQQPGVAADVEDEQLLVSFNSINVFKPYGICAEWKTTTIPWWHVDNPKPDPAVPLSRQRAIFSGVLNLRDVSAETGGFCCVPKSHLLFGAQQSEPSGDNYGEGYLDIRPFDNYIDSEPNERTGNTTHTQPVLVCTGGRRGTLLLWDPRMVHCNCASLLADELNERAREPQLLRLAAYVSMCPRSWATPEALEERSRVVEQRLSISSHIPCYVDARQQKVWSTKVFYEGLWEDPECLAMIG